MGISKPFEFEGPGVHTGVGCTVRVMINEATVKDHCRKSLRNDFRFICNGAEIPAHPRNLMAQCHRSTCLSSPEGTVQTVEHLLAALSFFFDKATVEVNGPEIPIMDGSALPFVKAFSSAGNSQNHVLFEVNKTIEIKQNESQAIIVPCSPGESPVYSVHLRYPPPIGDMTYKIVLDELNFLLEVAPARTYVLEKEVTQLRNSGLALGGTLQNALVINDHGPLNSDGMRFPNEPARHKMLDLLGDLALLGAFPAAHLDVYHPGHKINHEIVRRLSL
ncbi:MAG: UDP-3-O-[3-hydroxymyristoyl] N-acetylglucosamine deacetylase [Deltaproteobacteria bacterium]|nr:UDP-3-O-[3-hydroxymyristoyl] N-acetylglucosamine deacetylase [Deltaproteobacteria bacterium]